MIELVIQAAIAFFVTIEPIGVGAIFAGLTRGESRERKRRLAIRATAIAALILLAFALVGEALMAGLGISVAALRTAGGVLLLLLAVDMVFARPSGIRSMTASETAEAGQRDDIAVFPVAIPLIAGPGAITSTILFMGRASGDPVAQAAVLAVLLIILALTLVVLWFAVELSRLLGITGINVLNRVLGILLAALACQFILDGIRGSGLVG